MKAELERRLLLERRATVTEGLKVERRKVERRTKQQNAITNARLKRWHEQLEEAKEKANVA
jgi:hypothetical protein